MSERQWNTLGIAACIAGAGVLVAHILSPIQGPGKRVQDRMKQESKLNKEIKQMRDDVKRTRQSNESRLWTYPEDQVAAVAMARSNEQAAAHQLKLMSFRPQRKLEDGGVSRLPYLISLQGSFPNVISFVEALGTPKNRLTVNLIQIASADGATDSITATVGIVAYREQEQVKK